MSVQKPTVDKSARRVKAMFGALAPKYDLLNRSISFGLDRGWRRRCVSAIFKLWVAEKRAAPREKYETLDVATGTGDVVLEERRQWTRKGMARKLGAAELVTIGSDFVPQMLELARAKAPDVEFVEADGHALPFEDGRFDAVTNSFGLRNMEDPEKGVAEMARVCRKGGVVAILEFSPTKFPLFAPIFRFYFFRVMPLMASCFSKAQKKSYEYLPQSVDAFDSPAQVLDYMRRAGIVDPARKPMTFGVLGLYIGRKG